jgi:two-component system phosphate regulon sensor histidine kinase PhoR
VINSKDIRIFILVQVLFLITVNIINTPLFEGVFALSWIGYTVYFFKGILNKQDVEKVHQNNQIDYQVKQALELFESTNLQLSKLVDSLPGGVLLIDANGIIKIENQTFLNMFQLDSLFDKDYQLIQLIEPLYQAVFDAYTAEISKRTQIKSEERYYDLIMSTIVDESVFQGLLILVSDITELKTAEQFQKQFTADVSHELRTPLSAILGLTEILQNEGIDAQNRLEFITTIHHESKRLENLIKDLLVISKLDRIDDPLMRKPTQIKSLIEETSELWLNEIKNKDIMFELDLDEALLNIDEHKFNQVIVNLLTNAIKYTDQGSIIIKGRKLKDWYNLEFKDTGIGIAKEHQPFIFKRFYRVDNARSRDSGGSGLGLSIVKNVIVKHGGTIHVASEENQGTTFTVSVPI